MKTKPKKLRKTGKVRAPTQPAWLDSWCHEHVEELIAWRHRVLTIHPKRGIVCIAQDVSRAVQQEQNLRRSVARECYHVGVEAMLQRLGWKEPQARRTKLPHHLTWTKKHIPGELEPVKRLGPDVGPYEPDPHNNLPDLSPLVDPFDNETILDGARPAELDVPGLEEFQGEEDDEDQEGAAHTQQDAARDTFDFKCCNECKCDSLMQVCSNAGCHCHLKQGQDRIETCQQMASRLGLQGTDVLLLAISMGFQADDRPEGGILNLHTELTAYQAELLEAALKKRLPWLQSPHKQPPFQPHRPRATDAVIDGANAWRGGRGPTFD